MSKEKRFEETKQIITDVIRAENDRGIADGWDEPLCSAPEYLAEILAERLSDVCAPKSGGVTPCDRCRFNPPSSTDGKPCSICPAQAKTNDDDGAECPICHGTGRIGTTDWLTKNLSKKQIAEEKAKSVAKAIAEHEQYIKNVAVIEVLTKIEISTKAVISFVEDDTFASEEIRKAKLEAYKDTLNHVNKLKRQFAKETKR